MSFPWFRVYSEIRNDAKIRSLAFEDRWHFIALLTLKSEGVIDAIGDPAIRDRRIGLELGLDAKHAAEAKRRLIEAFLINDAWQPLNWSKRQFNSDRDPTNAERQRRFKEKQQLTKVKPVSNALPALPVTKITLTDTDTDTDTEKKRSKKRLRPALTRVSQNPDDMPASPATQPKDKPGTQSPRTPRRACALPKGFALDESMAAYATAKGLDPAATLEAFVAYHEAHGSTMKNWRAAWRTWCINAKRFRAREGPRSDTLPDKYRCAI